MQPLQALAEIVEKDYLKVIELKMQNRNGKIDSLIFCDEFASESSDYRALFASDSTTPEVKRLRSRVDTIACRY